MNPQPSIEIEPGVFVTFVKTDRSFRTYDFDVTGFLDTRVKHTPDNQKTPSKRVTIDTVAGQMYNLSYSVARDDWSMTYLAMRYEDTGKRVSAIIEKALKLYLARMLSAHIIDIAAIIPPEHYLKEDES